MSATPEPADERTSAGDDPLRDAGQGIDAPRLTPQGRSGTEPDGEDETAPTGGVKTGQPSKAEG